MQQLPAPEIVRCYFETRFEPHLPAMELRWDPEVAGVAERTWYLPDNVCLTLHRHGDDTYQVRVLWNRLCLCWEHLPRTEIMASSLSLVLAALGTDLWYLLSQPIEAAPAA